MEVHPADQPGVFQNGDERVGGDDLAVVVPVAHQRLRAHRLTGFRIHLGLEVQQEPAVRHLFAQQLGIGQVAGRVGMVAVTPRRLVVAVEGLLVRIHDLVRLGDHGREVRAVLRPLGPDGGPARLALKIAPQLTDDLIKVCLAYPRVDDNEFVSPYPVEGTLLAYPPDGLGAPR